MPVIGYLELEVNSAEPIIKIEDFCKHYPGAEVDALHNVNLEVMPGDFFGLLGPNGSGKTTLISILCGLLKPSHGSAFIDNKAVVKQRRAILPIIGLVPQEIALYESLSLRQNFRLFGNLYGLSGKFLQQRIAYCLEIAQLERFIDKPIHTFSGGMKRRANLALSLVHEPKLLFMDEPTVNVDPQSRNAIYESLEKLIAAGVTLFYTTHYLEEAGKLCSQIAIIDNGQIVKVASPQQLVASEPNCQNLGEVFMALTGKTLRDED